VSDKNPNFKISENYFEKEDTYQIKYIYDCIKNNKLLNIEEYINTKPIFHGLKFSASSSFSIEEIEKLISLIEYYGGEYVGTENKFSNYLIWYLLFSFIFLISFYSYEEEEIENYKGKMVHYQFINDCIQFKKLLNTENYKPQKQISIKNFFKNYKFFIIGYLPEIKIQLEDNIKYLGGTIESKYSTKITHFVCLFENCEFYEQTKKQKNIKIVTGIFIIYFLIFFFSI